MAVPHRLAAPARPLPGHAALHFLRRRRVIASGIGSALARPSRAQAPWPERPLRALVGFPPGTPPDIAMRLLTGAMGERLGQPVVVQQRIAEAVRAARETTSYRERLARAGALPFDVDGEALREAYARDLDRQVALLRRLGIEPE